MTDPTTTTADQGDPPTLLSDMVMTVLIGRRRQLGWSQTRLAREMGTTPAAVSRWENGKREPSIATLARIARAVGLEIRLNAVDSDGKPLLEPEHIEGPHWTIADRAPRSYP